MTQIEINVLLQNLALGACLGFLGQCIRVIVGLKKLKDQTGNDKQLFKEGFDIRKFFLSLLIGMVAGVLGVISLQIKSGFSTKITTALVVQLIAIGYAGTDFIEGFLSKVLPKPPAIQITHS